MNPHEQFSDDLALYALGSLEGEERKVVEAHLKDCVACREELQSLRGDVALMALTAAGSSPPARSRERLLAAVANEPRRVPVHKERKAAWWTAFQWAAAVAAVIVVVMLVLQNNDLRRQVTEAEENSRHQQQQLQEAKQLIATLNSPDADHYVLVASKNPPQPEGRAIYVAKSGTVVFLASNMPDLPPEKVYELWLIPTTGAPIPAGLFRPDARGSAAVVQPPIPPGIEAKTFAITIEPRAGSAAPTSTPIMVGTRG